MTAGEKRWKSPPTSLATSNVPVSLVAALVTLNCGEVPSPITNETVPLGLLDRPSPDHVTSSNRMFGGAPDGTASVIVTVVPIGRSTPDSAAKSLAAFSFMTTAPAFRPGAGSQAATTVKVTPASSGEDTSTSPVTFLATPKVPVSLVAVLVRVNSGEVSSPMTNEAVPSSCGVKPGPDQVGSPQST